MRRADFCNVLGIPAPTLMTHRRNGDLPFDAARGEDGDGKRVWVRYSRHEAAAWIAAQHLAAQGVTWSEAAAIVRGQRSAIYCGQRGNPWDIPGLHVARVEFLDERGVESALVDRFRAYAGPIDAIAREVAQIVAEFNAGRPMFRIVCSSLVAANLSHAYAIAAARMRELGIEGARDPIAEGEA